MTRSSVLVRVSGLCLLIGVCAAVAWGDEGTENGVPPSVQIGGLATPAQVSAPAGKVATPAAIETRATLVAQQVRAGLLSWAQAWQQHRLGRDEVLELLGRAQVIEGSSGPEDKALRLQLGALLARDLQSVQDEEAAAHWNPRARLALGSYWVSVRDARAVGLLERLWDERPLAQHSSFGFLVVEQWAHFYRDRGEHEKAAQTWMKLAQVEARNGGQKWWQPDAMLEAARAYAQAGNEEKSKALYTQVAQYGHGWSTGLAIYDQVQLLLAEGKAAQAHALLELPLNSLPNEAAQVVLLATRSQTHYQSGDWEKARRDSREALARFKALKPSQQGLGVDAVANASQRRLAWSEQWLKAPLDVEPKTLHLSWR